VPLLFKAGGTVSFVDLFADLRQRYQFSIYNSFSFLSLGEPSLGAIMSHISVNLYAVF